MKEEPIEEQPECSDPKIHDSTPHVSSTTLPQPMPALSTLAAHSIAVASRPPVVFAHKSACIEVKPCKAEEDVESEEGDAEEEEEDSEEMSVAEENKSSTPPLKRERRKGGARKAISREFIESDEDSPEDPGASNDSTPKVCEEEKASSDSTPSETAEDEDPVEGNNESEEVIAIRKHNSDSTVPSKSKAEEDLDVSFFKNLNFAKLLEIL